MYIHNVYMYTYIYIYIIYIYIYIYMYMLRLRHLEAFFWAPYVHKSNDI